MEQEKSTGSGGGLSTGPRGGLSTGSIPYMSKVPLWPIYIKELEKRGMNSYAEIIKKHNL